MVTGELRKENKNWSITKPPVNFLYFFHLYHQSWTQRHHEVHNCTMGIDRKNSKKSSPVLIQEPQMIIPTETKRVEKKSPAVFIFLPLWLQPPGKLQTLRCKVVVVVTVMVAKQETKILRQGTPFLWAKELWSKECGRKFYCPSSLVSPGLTWRQTQWQEVCRMVGTLRSSAFLARGPRRGLLGTRECHSDHKEEKA